MEGQNQIELDQIMGLQKVQSATQPDQHTTEPIDLSCQKVGAQIDLSQKQANQLFSKTATNEFLAMSNQGSVIMPETQLVSQMLDSQASSPTMKSDIALRTTAQFTNMHTYQNANFQQLREPAHQAVNMEDQVLATSGPQHLKSQSTGNTNYFSNGHVYANPAADYEQSQMTSNSQGRTTETRPRKVTEQVQGIHGLNGQGQAKSAVLQTNQIKQGGGAREIKKIPSKTKVSEKKQKKFMKDGGMASAHPQFIAQDNGFNLPNEMNGYHHKTSYSVGKNQPRNNSQTNRIGYQTDSLQNSVQMMQGTPVIQHAQPMFQPSPPMPTGDQYQGFSFMTPIGQNPFQFTGQGLPNGLTPQQHQQILAQSQMGYQMQPQPQVHFIAKQQKFYGISPERAPLIFKQGKEDKRPYTSSGHVLNKRTSKTSQQNSNIAALYLGSKTHNNGFGVSHHNQQQQRNQSQPVVEDSTRYQHATQAAYSMQAIPNRGNQKKHAAGTSNSAHVARKDKGQVGMMAHTMYSHMGPTQKMPEALQDEVLQLKQAANSHKEENIKLKTKIKILENEMGRKERTLEDFLQQNQFIQNAQKNAGNGTLAPIVQTAQRYQAETFLVMSLKKQVKEQKAEILKRDEELNLAKRNIKNTKFYEMDQEIKLLRDELIRLRYLLEQAYSQGENLQTQPTTGRPSAIGFNMSQGPQSPFMGVQQNQSQPTIMPAASSAGNTLKINGANISQNNLFPDTTSNLSQQVPFSSTQVPSQGNQYTLSHDDQVSNHTSEPVPSHLPPLKKQPSSTVSGQPTPIPNLATAQFNLQQQMSVDQQQSALTHQALSLSQVDTRENEFVQKLTTQIFEKDSLIRKLQQQIDDYGKQRIARLQNTHNLEGGKASSAGPTSKTELTKIKKQLREKEKEVQKLKTASNTQASQKSIYDEESEKKVKQLQSQVSQFLKKQQEMKAELKKKDEKNEQLQADMVAQADAKKNASEQRVKEKTQTQTKLQSQVDQMTKNVQDKDKENQKLNNELELTRKQISELQIKKEEAEKAIEKQKQAKQTQPQIEEKPEVKEKEQPKKAQKAKLEVKFEGELGLISTVLGCRENRDRIEFAGDLIDFVSQSKLTESEREKVKASRKHLGLASDYTLKISPELTEFVENTQQAELAKSMPRYDFIAPSLAMILMQEIKKMIMDPDLIEILNEKEAEVKLPFDALRDLCQRFDRQFSDEHCAFITASYLTEIDEGIIYINFKEFLQDLKDARGREFDITSSKQRATSSLGSECSDSEMKRIMKGGSSPISEILQRSAGKSAGIMGRQKKSVDEEHMLDIAESIFIKMADFIIAKEKSIRGIFTKYSVPEMFPDNTILELLSPGGFLEGIKEAGIEDLQDFEVACLMRVLAKPELDNAVILNEFVMIMENFGVPDTMEDEENDDYIPDTEQSVNQSVEQIPDAEEQKEKADDDKDDKSKTQKAKEGKEKKKPRQHNLENVDAKGVKILRKLARFLLKQFLHPREFFGKAISKEHIKTKKREFYLDTMKIKEFYLRIKIANIRKRLTENESLNNEICIDQKTHKDQINVKIMVKALEELAEEEQKVLLEEEKKQAENLAKGEAGEKKDTIGASDVETPRSDQADKIKDALVEETKTDSEKDDSTEAKKNKEEVKESYGVDSIKFGNARTKNITNSPSIAERAFVPLNTIEEERNETQTSNYLENISEREDSRLMSSNNFRGSNINGLEFEEEQKSLGHKMSPEMLNKTLNREDKGNSMSQVVSTQMINSVDANIDLPLEQRTGNQGRLTGRTDSLKENKLSQSLEDHNLDRFKSQDKPDEDLQIETPLTVQNLKAEGLNTPNSAVVISEGTSDQQRT